VEPTSEAHDLGGIISRKLLFLGFTGTQSMRALVAAGNEAMAAVKRVEALMASTWGAAHFFVTRLVERVDEEVKDRMLWTPLYDRPGVVDPNDDFCRSAVNLLVPHAYKHARLSRLAQMGAQVEIHWAPKRKSIGRPSGNGLSAELGRPIRFCFGAFSHPLAPPSPKLNLLYSVCAIAGYVRQNVA